MTAGYIEKSADASEKDIEKINSFTRRKFDMGSLYVFTVALCNNDIDRDFEKFSLSALNELKSLFVGRTGICDHSMKAGDQIARVFETWIEKKPGRKTADGEDFYELKAKAYMVKNEENASFITDIEAGIKKEVSISCSAASSVCSVCGKDRRKGVCEHIPGRDYDGSKAFCVLDNITDAYEFSFVAVPAQKEAGVTKSFAKEKDTKNMENIIEKIKNADGDITVTQKQADEISRHMTQLEDEARLGREYKKSLVDEVTMLFARAVPQMDAKVFGGVAKIMTANELMAFKKAFSEKSESQSAKLQFADECRENKVNQFKL